MDDLSFLHRSSHNSGSGLTPEGTRSIVLALRGLQDKIQTLEADRNHYKTAYERLLSTHEHQIRDVKDRSGRESEEATATLLRLQLERDRLQAQVDEVRANHSQSQREFEALLRHEKQRADRVEEENIKQRLAAQEGREKAVELKALLEDACRQRDVAELSTKRLQEAMKDFASLNANLVDRIERPHSAQGHVLPSPRYTSPTTASRNRATEQSPVRALPQAPVPMSAATALLKDLEAEYSDLLQRFKTAMAANGAAGERALLTDQGLAALVGAMERKAEQIALLRRGERARSPQRRGSQSRSQTPTVRGLDKKKVTMQTLQELRNLVNHK